MKRTTTLGFGGLGLLALSLVFLPLQAESAPNVERVLMKEGKPTVPDKDGGKMVPLTEDLELSATIRVSTNGTFTVNKGKPRELKDGQILGKDGMLLSPDGKLEPVIDHAVLVKGRMMVFKDGVGTPVTREMTLPNGTRVEPNGTVHTFDGKFRRLLEGQLFELDGKVVPSKDTVTLLKGKVMVQKEGVQFEIQPGRTIMMNEGTKVFGEGYAIKRDGSRVTLAEGQVLTLEGVVNSKR